jgi:hypothetical protein
MQWNFLRSLDEKIEWEECSLNLMNGAATKECAHNLTSSLEQLHSV